MSNENNSYTMRLKEAGFQERDILDIFASVIEMDNWDIDNLLDGLNLEISGPVEGVSNALSDMSVSQKLKNITLIDNRITKNSAILYEYTPLLRQTRIFKDAEKQSYEKVVNDTVRKICSDVDAANEIVNSLNQEYIFTVLNEVYAIGRHVDDSSQPEFEARCKECGKLLYKFEDNMSKGTFIIEAHCGNCKTLRKTTHGTNKY